MALDKEQLEKDILELIKNPKEVKPEDQESPMENFVKALAEIIDTYIKTADMNFQVGEIKVTGTASAQTNTSKITISNGLS